MHTVAYMYIQSVVKLGFRVLIRSLNFWAYAIKKEHDNDVSAQWGELAMSHEVISMLCSCVFKMCLYQILFKCIYSISLDVDRHINLR